MFLLWVFLEIDKVIITLFGKTIDKTEKKRLISKTIN